MRPGISFPPGLTVDELPLETFVGPARVVDLTSQGDLPITAETVRGAKLNGATRVLSKLRIPKSA